MRGMGWGSSEPPKPANEEIGVKPSLNAGSPRLQSWSSSLEVISNVSLPKIGFSR